ncbi:PHP domain-containing protein [Thermincola ferriacetica]
MAVDLHIHTTASDGNISPAEVIDLAVQAGLRTIAFADHENTAGYTAVKDMAEGKGLEIIPALELQTWHKNKEIHILGYFIDVNDINFQKRLTELRKDKNRCAMAMVEKIRRCGFDIGWDEVERLSCFGGPISKGHIMQVLKLKGYIKTREDAARILGLYFNQEGKAYSCYNFPSAEAVDLIKSARGIPILAHPGLIGDDNLVLDLIKMGISGLEVYYNYFGPNKNNYIAKYEKMALDHGLLMTGGSDYHGTITPVVLGETEIPDAVVASLKESKKLF